MEAKQAIPEWRAVADEIWALVRENARELKEWQEKSRRETEELKELQRENAQGFKELRESQKETEKLVKETSKQMKQTDKRIGELGNRFGEMVEHMVIPNLVAKFKELGFTFTKANRTEIESEEHNIFVEVDAFLENGDKVMIVEIKSKPKTEDIDDHIERMEKLRWYANLHNDKRVYLGAVAGVVFSKSEKIYALRKGFYVIEPSGDTFNITEPVNPRIDWQTPPREW